MPTRRVIALVAAAGQGTRLGAEVPKAFVPLRGRTLLERSVAATGACELVDATVVVVSREMEPAARRALTDHDVRFVHGGAERADSIWQGLKAIADEDAVVLIHDAARALTPPDMFARVVRSVAGGERAVVPVVPVADTIKTVVGTEVTGTPERASLRAVQTPQGFDLRALRSANEAYYACSNPGFTATDDASLMEWHGERVTTVEGDPLAFKITTPMDLRLAASIVADAEAGANGADGKDFE